jgi:hypothetical protein
MVTMMERQGSRGGCPIGTLAAAVADTNETLREPLNDAFNAWRDAISGALKRLRDNHLLALEADLDNLTAITLAAIEGGLLLAKTARDSTQLRIALDGAIAQLRANGSAPRKRTTKARVGPGTDDHLSETENIGTGRIRLRSTPRTRGEARRPPNGTKLSREPRAPSSPQCRLRAGAQPVNPQHSCSDRRARIPPPSRSDLLSADCRARVPLLGTPAIATVAKQSRRCRRTW